MLGPSHYNIKTSVIPVGDWHFHQDNPATGQPIPLRAQSWEDLIAAVRTFRINANLPIGDPAAEVSEYTRRNSPQNDTGSSKQGPFIPNRFVPITPLAERIKDWLVGLENQQVKLVEYDQLMGRIKTCADCPQNIEWETSCGDCNFNIRYKGQIVRRKAAFAHDDNLRGCRAVGIYLPAAVFLETGLPVRSERCPKQCWLPLT